MSDTATFTIVKDETTPAKGLREAGRSLTIECDVPDCDYTVWSWLPANADPARLIQDHLDQHAPGRALNIDVEWEVSAACSVCTGDGDVQVDDEGDLTCGDCGTTWSIKGRHGYRKDNDHAR